MFGTSLQKDSLLAGYITRFIGEGTATTRSTNEKPGRVVNLPTRLHRPEHDPGRRGDRCPDPTRCHGVPGEIDARCGEDEVFHGNKRGEINPADLRMCPAAADQVRQRQAQDGAAGGALLWDTARAGQGP